LASKTLLEKNLLLGKIRKIYNKTLPWWSWRESKKRRRRKKTRKQKKKKKKKKSIVITSFAGAHSSSLHSSGAFTALILGSSATFCNKNLLDCCCNEGTKAVVPRELR
jgi:hypothetical protein